MEEELYTWTGFYEKFADKLLTFKDDREALIERIQAAFDSIDMELPSLDSAPRPADIDPFTVFGLFNNSNMKKRKRQIIVDALAYEFDIEAELPRDYYGVPFINNRALRFYAPLGDSRRGERDIDNIWSVFEKGITLAEDDSPTARDSFCDAYDLAIGQYGIKWKLTMGAFWMRPNFFVSFDASSRLFMSDRAMVGSALARIVPKHNVPNGGAYLEMCGIIRSCLGTDECPYQSLPALSDAAFKEFKHR